MGSQIVGEPQVISKGQLLVLLQEQTHHFCVTTRWNGRCLSLAEAMLRARALPDNAEIRLVNGGIIC